MSPGVLPEYLADVKACHAHLYKQVSSTEDIYASSCKLYQIGRCQVHQALVDPRHVLYDESTNGTHIIAVPSVRYRKVFLTNKYLYFL